MKHFILTRLTLAGSIAALAFTTPAVRAAEFNLSTATIQDINAAFSAGALTSEKLVTLYLARIAAYDQKGPSLNSIILVNPQALAEARALDAERKAGKVRSPLHGIPVLVKDNFDVVGLPNTGGSFLLEGNISSADAPNIKGLRDAGAIMLAKTNLDEFAAGGIGFSSLGGQTKNPHDLNRVPLGSSGGTGVGLAAWFAPLGLGTDTGGSIRGPAFANGVVGIKPTNGLLSRSGIIPRVLTFDTGGPMARSVYDAALALGYMTGVDPADPLTSRSAGLFQRDYTPYLRKDALKGARLGVVRDFLGQDPEVDRLFEAALVDLRAQGAELVDPINFPKYVLESRASIMDAVRDVDIREQYKIYLAPLAPQFPKTLTEMIARSDAFTSPRGKLIPYPALYDRFRVSNAGPSPESLSYLAAKDHGMAMVRDGVLGLMERHRLDALVYPTRPTSTPLIRADAATFVPDPASVPPSLTNIANVTQFPDVQVPAGLTKDKLPITISFLGPAFSEPRILGYAYAFEQARPRITWPSTTPALPGEKFTY